MPPALCTQRRRQRGLGNVRTTQAAHLFGERLLQHLVSQRNAEAVTQPPNEVHLRAAAALEPTAASNGVVPAARAFFSFSCSAMRDAASLTCVHHARASAGRSAGAARSPPAPPRLCAERHVQPLAHGVSGPLHATAVDAAAVACCRRHRARRPTLVPASCARRRLRVGQLPFLRLLRRCRSSVAASTPCALVATRASVVHLCVCAADELSAAARPAHGVAPRQAQRAPDSSGPSSSTSSARRSAMRHERCWEARSGSESSRRSSVRARRAARLRSAFAAGAMTRVLDRCTSRHPRVVCSAMCMVSPLGKGAKASKRALALQLLRRSFGRRRRPPRGAHRPPGL